MTQSRATEPKPIPTFNNEAEAAAFWDTHSPEDYPDQFVEAEVRFSRPLIKRGLSIKMRQNTSPAWGQGATKPWARPPEDGI